MKIQQSTPSSYTHSKKPNNQPQQSTPVSVDTVEIGKRTASMEADIGKLYAQYRTSNSQYDQNYLKREMLATLDSGNAALAKKEKLKELLTRLFNKNDRAWSLKEQVPTSHPKTETEFHQQKHTVAAGQPLCGDNLFHLDRWQRSKNLIPLMGPKKECKSVYDDITDDLNYLAPAQSKKNDRMGSVEDDVKRDLELLGARRPKVPGESFASHLINRLA